MSHGFGKVADMHHGSLRGTRHQDVEYEEVYSWQHDNGFNLIYYTVVAVKSCDDIEIIRLANIQMHRRVKRRLDPIITNCATF